MKVTVKLGSTLREHSPADFQRGEGKVELPEGSGVGQLLARLGVAPEEVNLVYRNHKLVTREAPLIEGDRVALFPPNFIHFSQFYLKRQE
jgi:molybdopterin converting factor small subunit